MPNNAALNGPLAKALFGQMREITREMRLDLLECVRTSARIRQDELTDTLLNVLEEEALLDGTLRDLERGNHMAALSQLDSR